jgi:tetratricopeptide (TPR) repeat protein
MKIANIESLGGNRSEAIHNYESAMKVYQSLLETQPSERGALTKVLSVCIQLGSTREQALDLPGALETFRGCMLIAQRTASVDPAARRAVALVRERIASLSAKCGITAGVEEEMKTAVAIYEQDVAENPGSRSQRNLAKGYKVLAELQRRGRDYADALVSARRSLALLEDLLGRDPKNKQLQIDYHMGLILIIDLLNATGDSAAARVETARAVRFLRPLVESPEPALHDVQDYVLLLVSTPFREHRDDAAALRFARRAVEITSRKDAESLDLLARALDRSGDHGQAVATEREALALIPAPRPGLPDSEARMAMEANLRRFQAQASAKAAAQHQNR